MPIAFNDIPAALRLPGVYIEFDNRLAGGNDIARKVLYIGQRLAAGSVAAGVPTRVTNVETQPDDYFGRGSMLSEMLKAGKAADPWMDTWAIALNENGAGVAASGTITATGPATAAGTINLYIAGKRVQVAVTAGQAQNSIATAIAAAINGDNTLPITAAVNGVTLNQVDLTCRWRGETGNAIDVRANYYGESLPKGVALAIVALAGGTTNPDIATAIAAFGNEWWNWIVMPFTDAANLTALETELNDRWGPMEQKGARAFTAHRGTLSATTTFGNGRNSAHVSCIGTGIAPEPPYIWAAVNAQAAAKQLAIDPARPLNTVVLTGLKAPAIADRWTDSERNLALYDGISTYKVIAGSCVIEKQITMYQLNASGIADTSYLPIHVPETLERMRFDRIARISQKFPRHKLSATDEKFGAGQPVMTSALMRSELADLYKGWIEKAWCQDFEGYMASVVIEIDTQNSRVSVQDSPRLIGQAEVFAQQIQFRR